MRIHQLTSMGMEILKKEFNALSAKRPAAIEELKRAREMGDLSENAAYKVARQTLSALDSRLRFLGKMIKNSVVYKSDFSGKVALGTEVTIETGEQTIVYLIVDTFEADPAKGKISADSPIGKALLGRAKGEEVSVITPGGLLKYRIQKIISKNI